jgi:hypothetical protein
MTAYGTEPPISVVNGSVSHWRQSGPLQTVVNLLFYEYCARSKAIVVVAPQAPTTTQLACVNARLHKPNPYQTALQIRCVLQQGGARGRCRVATGPGQDFDGFPILKLEELLKF